jgi:hypothetical protein
MLKLTTTVLIISAMTAPAFAQWDRIKRIEHYIGYSGCNVSFTAGAYAARVVDADQLIRDLQDAIDAVRNSCPPE